jgi:hypothetical protein
MVTTIEARMSEASTRESEASYNVGMRTKSRHPEEYVEEFKARIVAEYPDVDFKVVKRGDNQYTLKVYGDYSDMSEVPEVLGNAPIDLLMDDDIWIVVLGLDRHPLDH